ncbi:MAG: hypothetical protein KDB22_28040 [Planctomycetales bacterium]|nr:hypothetical protein [Planctomycetales bacterium]
MKTVPDATASKTLAQPPSAISVEERRGGMYLARVGCLGAIGRFENDTSLQLSRNKAVVVRTSRGVEQAVVLGRATNCTDGDNSDGRILRGMRNEDEVLWLHLQSLAKEAFQACSNWLAEHQSSATLLDVEPLLDGKTLYFHFLSSVDAEIQLQVDELAAIYEQHVSKSKFAKLVEHGCGPGCGTESATGGCSSKGGCAVCSVADACRRSAANPDGA